MPTLPQECFWQVEGYAVSKFMPVSVLMSYTADRAPARFLGHRH